jgi:hypothetical protein
LKDAYGYQPVSACLAMIPFALPMVLAPRLMSRLESRYSGSTLLASGLAGMLDAAPASACDAFRKAALAVYGAGFPLAELAAASAFVREDTGNTGGSPILSSPTWTIDDRYCGSPRGVMPSRPALLALIYEWQ